MRRHASFVARRIRSLALLTGSSRTIFARRANSFTVLLFCELVLSQEASLAIFPCGPTSSLQVALRFSLAISKGKDHASLWQQKIGREDEEDWRGTEVWPESPGRVPNPNRDASIKGQNRSKLAQEIDLKQCYLLVVILITILLVELEISQRSFARA